MGGHQPKLNDLALTKEMVAAVREAVGTRADLLVGTHGQFTAAGAQRVARELAPCDPLGFGEQVRPVDVGARVLLVTARQR